MTGPATGRPPVALVTGAGSGIGRAAAVALAGAGFALVLAGRRRDALEAVSAIIGGALVVPTDVTSESSVEALFATAAERLGRVDVVFNNAGVSAPVRGIDELSLEDWHRVVDTNLTGVFLCARAAFAQMKRQSPSGGRIINNGSISAHAPRPLAVAYNATKHGVAGITKSIALEGRPFGIACSQIDIGNAATHMTERMSQGVVQANGSTAPEPVMHVSHAASAVAYMASLPLEANVQFMTVMATNMPFIGRG